MSELEKFTELLDNYIKLNKEKQPEDKNYITIEIEVLLVFANSIINSESKRKLERKLMVIKDVLDL